MRRLILLIALCLLSLPVQSDDEYRFGVWGTFTLTPEGTVEDVEYVGGPPSVLEDFVESAMSAWRFEPVIEGGGPISIRVSFFFELVGAPDGDEVVVIMNEPRYSEVLPVRPLNYQAPVYPRRALLAGVEAQVNLEFLTGPDGQVTDVHVTSVGLLDNGRLRGMSQSRLVRDFSGEASRTVRRWRFAPPADGEVTPGRQCFRFYVGERWQAGESPIFIWHDMEPAPWQQENGESVVRNAPVNGEFDLGDARIRRVEDAVPAS